MCGIHGFFNGAKRSINADDFISNAFVAGSLRGIDSSGIASIDTVKKDIAWQKLPVMGPMFITDKYAATLIRNASDANTLSICHTRSATSGKIGINQAHPFFVEDETGVREMIGVHNGTLTGWHSKKNGKFYDVDSEWALNHIFDEGFDAFEDFSGAYCFVWWDSEDSEVLNIALNNERPMFAAFTDDDSMVYASEAGMLYWLCERNKIKLTSSVVQLTSNFWYSFNRKNLKEFTKRELPKSKVTYTPVNNNNYIRPSVMTKVAAMLDRISKAEITDADRAQAALVTAATAAAFATEPKPKQALTLVTTGPRASVSANEMQSARDLSLMNDRGAFLPNWQDDETGDIYGLYCQGNSIEMDAIIRSCHNIEYDSKTSWAVTIIGVMDDGKNLTAICDKPNFVISDGNGPARPNTKPLELVPTTSTVH